MVFKGGAAKIGLYFGEEELRGEDALKQIIADSLSEECRIYVGTYSYDSSSIRVDHVIKRYSDAKIDLDNLNLEDKINSIREEERRRRIDMIEEEKKERELGLELVTRKNAIYNKQRDLEREIELRRERERDKTETHGEYFHVSLCLGNISSSPNSYRENSF